jgi:hypothetical protein
MICLSVSAGHTELADVLNIRMVVDFPELRQGMGMACAIFGFPGYAYGVLLFRLASKL